MVQRESISSGETPRILVYSGMDWESTNVQSLHVEAHAFP